MNQRVTERETSTVNVFLLKQSTDSEEDQIRKQVSNAAAAQP